jgi:hypothetical protein
VAYEAQVLEVMIASPSDVTVEREIVRDIVAEWNAINARERAIVMLPLGWDTHSSPELGGRPQQMINDRILAHADILIGIFWTKLGTPTGVAKSGTAEEIQEHHSAGKPVLLYFSDVPVVARDIDREQMAALEEFRAWAQGEGLVHSYSTKDEFRDDLRRHLQICVQTNDYIQGLTAVDFVAAYEAALGPAPSAHQLLGDDEKLLLTHAGVGTNALIAIFRHMGGASISAGGHKIAEEASPREVARWEAALSALYDLGLIKDLNGKGEIFELTHKGFLQADQFQGSAE